MQSALEICFTTRICKDLQNSGGRISVKAQQNQTKPMPLLPTSTPSPPPHPPAPASLHKTKSTDSLTEK